MSSVDGLTTRNQRWAERAYQVVNARKVGGDAEKEYLRFAKRFPSLIHTCGLAQSISFAQARGHGEVVSDLVFVLSHQGDLPADSRRALLPQYLRLSREALAAASWIKRYAEAFLTDPEKGTGNAIVP